MKTAETGPGPRGVPECARCAVKDKACRAPDEQEPPFCPSALVPGPHRLGVSFCAGLKEPR